MAHGRIPGGGIVQPRRSPIPLPFRGMINATAMPCCHRFAGSLHLYATCRFFRQIIVHALSSGVCKLPASAQACAVLHNDYGFLRTTTLVTFSVHNGMNLLCTNKPAQGVHSRIRREQGAWRQGFVLRELGWSRMHLVGRRAKISSRPASRRSFWQSLWSSVDRRGRS